MSSQTKFPIHSMKSWAYKSEIFPTEIPVVKKNSSGWQFYEAITQTQYICFTSNQSAW